MAQSALERDGATATGTRDQRQLGAAAAEEKEGARKRKGAFGWGERRRASRGGFFFLCKGTTSLSRGVSGARLETGQQGGRGRARGGLREAG